MEVLTRMMILPPMVEKVIDTSWHKGTKQNERFTFSRDCGKFPYA